MAGTDVKFVAFAKVPVNFGACPEPEPIYGNNTDKSPDTDAIFPAVLKPIVETPLVTLYGVDVEFAEPPKLMVLFPALSYVHVYWSWLVPERAIVFPVTPVPDNTPPTPQSTTNVPFEERLNKNTPSFPPAVIDVVLIENAVFSYSASHVLLAVIVN